MKKGKCVMRWLSVGFAIFVSSFGFAHHPGKSEEANLWKNDIPPRLQWNANFGYCGEVSLISAGLYYGQYISQYTARSIASPNIPQKLAKSQLMLGINAHAAATKMHLRAIVWDSEKERSTPQFLSWVKTKVLKGYPVVIGVYTNEYRFYGNSDPHAGDAEFDHIVPVIGIESNHPFSNSHYDGEDVIYFSDNGLWGNAKNRPYIFNYPFVSFQANRKKANAKHGSIYSLANNGKNYGIAITGVIDLNGDTLPLRVTTDLNFEKPAIKNKTSVEPVAMPLVLTVMVSDLEPHVLYNLYRYNEMDLVPDSNFNTQAENAYESWQIQIESGSTYVMTETIQSNEIAVYRAVKATAP